MPKAVLDTTVLVSALLRHIPGGASYELLRFAEQGAFELYLSDGILEETMEALLKSERNRRRYNYSDENVAAYCHDLALLAVVLSDVPEVRVVIRDPNDDMIIACALAAGAEYVVTRDKDMLSLGTHGNISIISPEAFLQVLRALT